MRSMKQTFHIHLKRGKATHRVVVMAFDHSAARVEGDRIAAELGFTVDKVRRAPTTPVDNLARKRRSS